VRKSLLNRTPCGPLRLAFTDYECSHTALKSHIGTCYLFETRSPFDRARTRPRVLVKAPTCRLIRGVISEEELTDPSCPVCGSANVTPIPDHVLILEAMGQRSHPWLSVPPTSIHSCPTPRPQSQTNNRDATGFVSCAGMDSSKDNTLEQLTERSRSLVRGANQLKREQEALLRQPRDLHERISTDDHQE
jgi:hypothetical protein